MHEAADFPGCLALAIADPDNRKQPLRVEEQRNGVVRRMGQYNYEQQEDVVRQPDEHLGSL